MLIQNHLKIGDMAISLPSDMRPVHTVIIHCSATPEGKDVTVDQIRKMHLSNGWKDIGYHFVIYRDGSIHTGRPLNQIGAHAAGHNTGSVGICYIGGMDAPYKHAKDTRTPQQQQSLVQLVQQLVRTFGPLKIYGHNQFSNKSCPCFDVPSWAQANHLFDAPTAPTAPAPPRPAKDDKTWLEKIIEKLRRGNKPAAPSPTPSTPTPRSDEPRAIPIPAEPLPPLEEDIESFDAPEEPGWWNGDAPQQ